MSDTLPSDEISRYPCTSLPVRGAYTAALPRVDEARGSLVFGQVAEHLPFAAKRFWMVFDVPPGRSRGGHAHRHLEEFIVCGRGSCIVSLDDGTNRTDVVLDRPDVGLYIPRLTWASQRYGSGDTLLFVVASEVYRPDDYVRDYGDFLELVRPARQGYTA
jgi:hypothetical protein